IADQRDNDLAAFGSRLFAHEDVIPIEDPSFDHGITLNLQAEYIASAFHHHPINMNGIDHVFIGHQWQTGRNPSKHLNAHYVVASAGRKLWRCFIVIDNSESTAFHIFATKIALTL